MVGIEADQKRPIFYGWWVLAIAFLCQMLAMGGTFYAFGLFVKPLAADFGLSRAEINNGMILWLLGMALASPIIGKLLDLYPARLIMALGAVLMGSGMLLISITASPLGIGVAVLLFVGPGSAALGPLPASTLVSRWFSRYRGRALGISAVATSMGGFAVVPVLGAIIELSDWRTAVLIEGGLVILLLPPLTLWLIRSRPADVGLSPDGDIAAIVGEAHVSETGWSVSQLMRNGNFWLITLGVGMFVGAAQAMMISLIPYAADRGIDLPAATLLVSASSLSNICGKLAFGAVADRFDKRWSFALVALFTVFFLLLLTMHVPYPALFVGACLSGLGSGGLLPVWGALLADTFGSRSYGTAMGIMTLLHLPLGLVLIRFVGEVPDRTGSYDIAYYSFAALAVCSIAMILMVRLRSQTPDNV